MTSRIRTVVFYLGLCLVLVGATGSVAQEPQPQEQPAQPQIHIDWQRGPVTAKLGEIAEIEIPEGYRFTDKAGAEKVLQATHNLISGQELGAIVSNDSGWFMIFEFEDTGYVKDDDKLDADAILKSITENTENANQQRSKRGWRPIHVTGWQTAPFYDPQTHNLTWASLVKGDNPAEEGSVNHSVRILGRKGTMNVDLVASPTEYAATTGNFATLMSGFHFTDGNRYSDFTKGDKMAEYGLTALIVGGGAAVALKTGLLGKLGILLLKLWKVIIVGFVAIGAAIKKFFQNIFGKEEKIEDPNKNSASAGQ